MVSSAALVVAVARLLMVTSAFCALSMTSSMTPLDSTTGENSTLPYGDRLRREATSRKLIVTTILEEPYMMMKERGAFLAGNQRFEGYLADILQRLSTAVGFQYETRLSRDGKYGELGPDGNWNGMIGEVESGEADIAAGALIVTDTLRKYVNFTEPFLSMRWSALLRRPPPPDPSATHPSNRRPLSSTIGGSVSSRRLTTASQLLRSDIPWGVVENSVAHQMLATSVDPVAQSLYHRMTSLSQFSSSYRGGSSLSSTSSPDPFVRSVQEGIDRARRERYAFILDSPTAEYVASREPCDLYTIEPFLDVATYAFAIRKRGPLSGASSSTGGDDSRQLRLAIDREMRRMKQSGEMQQMYLRWWRDECGPSFPLDSDSEEIAPVDFGRGGGGGMGRRYQPPETATSSGDVARRHTRVSTSTASASLWRQAETRGAARWTIATLCVVATSIIASAGDVLTFFWIAVTHDR